MNGVVMKTLFHTLTIATLLLLLIVGTTASALAQTARIEVSQLEHLTAKASETVDVNIDEKLLQMTAKLFSNKGDEAKIKDLINGLKGIYVKSFEFEQEGVFSNADVESIRVQLRNPSWNRIVGVNSRKEGSVEVYLMTNGSQVGGLAVLAVEPKELTIVNIIGPVDLEKLSELEGQFGVPELGIEDIKPKTKN